MYPKESVPASPTNLAYIIRPSPKEQRKNHLEHELLSTMHTPTLFLELLLIYEKQQRGILN